MDMCGKILYNLCHAAQWCSLLQLARIYAIAIGAS